MKNIFIGLLLITHIGLLSNCKVQSSMQNQLTIHPLRLKPGQDLKIEIQNYVQKNNIKAGWISTCVGSFTDYSIRFANQPNNSTGKGFFEIVSLTGTVSINGSHLHVSISDSTGKTIGGHLANGCKIYTTAEIILICTNDFEFTRENDGTTPWKELSIKNNKK